MNQTVGIFRVERIHYPLGPLSQQDLHYFSADLTNSSTNVLVTENAFLVSKYMHLLDTVQQSGVIVKFPLLLH